MTSIYFQDLAERYQSEIDDLRSDSEGKDVLGKRLKEKRDALSFLLPMIEEAPDMVAPVFHGAFTIRERKLIDQAARGTPGLGKFPRWKDVVQTLQVAPWAQPLIELVLHEPDGDAFLVSCVVLEWLLNEDLRRSGAASMAGDDEADDVDDLGESGEGWMSEQGFDAIDR
ncbi:hypothetical protein [Zoogloea sp.]|uniref:hypothetical protein n=1 Tax=Zoogloea sp. TaxID=49181 RepID=UPI00262B0995|nr:hypothetical protein [Zoogloea sp.]MDD3353994.1 hypothetical protein [Zoogloea sp.]